MVKVEVLLEMRKSNIAHQLIDIREPYEAEICSIGGDFIPMSEVLDRKDEIRKDIPVVVMCKTGKRAAAVADTLSRCGFDNVSNLDGGIIAWIEKVDTSLEIY